MSSYTNFEDHELLASIKSGDEGAFTEIYNRYWESLYRSAFHVLKDRDVCMDVLQEVFIWIWNHRTQLQVTSLKSYLYGAVKYKIANSIRDGKTRGNLYHAAHASIPDTSFVDSSVEVAELKLIIQQFTEGLPDRCKEVFHLSRSQQLNNKEIASKLNISEKTVENQLTIALKRLRLKLGRDY
ncbi:RNA polymerase sigma-70 factor [Sphingobacterium sp. SGG-5]|uniref:RNA polymerase sigma factor n=1 Tax=Sphingobacterium sp. SGG-5 TaxID=2710881 RepID=UPI0013EC1624|nr:RNA polymerase sigma-70 factor [Sphingobacterium sp. SGG-5]NGM61603.1 RNA polymerase sigma-70 factor [Sphingobacterium sp. SGG-5]